MLLLAIGFWGGYTASAYRAEQTHLRVAQRFAALSLASFMLRSVELIDSEKTESLRRKQLAVARSQIEPLPDVTPGATEVLSMPFLLEAQTDHLRYLNESQEPALRATLKRLETMSSLRNSNGS